MIFVRSKSRSVKVCTWQLAVACLLLISFTVGAAEPKPATDAVASGKRSTEEWKSLFDGASLQGWQKSGFDGEGDVKVEKPFRDRAAAIVIGTGAYLSGISLSKGDELPRMNYEVRLEAMKVEGRDFFCALTFPVGKSDCTFVAGGWGGSVVGLSSVDHSDASDNDTSTSMDFVPNRWYRIRVRVTPKKIEAWIDDTNVVELETDGRMIGLRFGDIERSLPLGIATYQTSAAVSEISIRRL